MRKIALSLGLLLGLALLEAPAFAAGQQGGGYFEFSLNGSWYRYANGMLDNDLATTTNIRGGSGLAYRFLSNTAVEVNYIYSRTIDHSATPYAPEGLPTEHLYIDKTSEMHNLSVNLVLYFAQKGSAFRPYIRGGGGYMVRQQKLSVTNVETGGQLAAFPNSRGPIEKSVSADAGIGLNLFVADSIALEGSFNMYATDLDKPAILLSYAASGGLRFVF